MWQPAHPFRLLQPPLILFLRHTLADPEEVGEEVLADPEEVGEEEQVDQGVQVVQVALAGQGELATQEVVDTAAMAEEGLEILGMIPQGGPPTTPCLNLRTCLAC